MASFRSTNIGRVLWLVTIYGGLLFASSAMSRLTVAQSSGPDPADLLRQFDVDGDGKVTVAEGGPGAQQFVRRMLEMAGKNADDSLNLEDIRRVVGLHRRQSQRTPPGANTDRPPAANPSRDARPSAVPAGRSRNTRPNRPVTPSGPLQSRLAGTWRGWVVDGRGENPDGGHMQMELRVEHTTSAARIGRWRVHYRRFGRFRHTRCRRDHRSTCRTRIPWDFSPGRRHAALVRQQPQWCSTDRTRNWPRQLLHDSTASTLMLVGWAKRR
jgi:hypothetical protein